MIEMLANNMEARQGSAEKFMDTHQNQFDSSRGSGAMASNATALVKAAAGVLFGWLVVAGQSMAADLLDLRFSSLPSGSFEAQLQFDSPPPEPQGYTIEKPARISLDFPGVASKLKEKKHTLGYENASSAMVLESGGRTRMILNLVQLAPYTTRVEGNTLYVRVGDAGARDYLKPVRSNNAISSAIQPAAAAGDVGISNIDFRRGDVGEGRLVVTLTDPKADVNAFVEGQRIKVEFKGAALPESLRRRFDVTDFATPVKLVDAQYTSSGAVISLQAIGEYDYLAYQTDNEYVISVKPLTKEEVDERKKEFAYTGERLSLNFQDIEVRAVLQIIADFTGLNLVASDTVGGRITLRLQNVPWDQALDLVLKTKGLDKRQIGNVLLVAPAAEIAERERTELETRRQVQELAPLQTEHIRIRYAKAKDLFTLFDPKSNKDGGTTSSILSARGRVIVDERTNSLLVTETAQKLEEFRRIVKLLDVPIRQVLIEARIVIANSNFDEQLGIQWGGAYAGRVNSGNGMIEGGGSMRTITGDNSAANVFFPGEDDDAAIIFPDALGVDLGISNPTGSIAIGYTGSSLLLNMELSALQAQGRGEIVSQPKVITGDKQQATIKSGTEVPYQESSANGETTISFKEAVLKLDVTPSITPDDRVIMDLEINQDSVGDLVPSGNGGFVPTIETNAVKTQVLVGNGETVVLGGVFRTEDVSSTHKVPFLGDIPYVGRLFKSTSTRQVKSEILVFITPRILADTMID